MPSQRPIRGAAVVLALVIVLTGCQWSMARFDAAGTGYNPYETALDTGDVAGLGLELTATTAGSSSTVPVVSGATVYVTTTGSGLQAYDLSGAGCTGTPLVCQPLWSAAAGATVGQAIVAGGTVFVAVGADLHAYDAAGTTGCAGTPVVCQPLWTAPGWGGNAVAADGRVYVTTADGKAAAFDAAGASGCAGSPKVCQPLWTYAVYLDAARTGVAPPVVADGVLYVGVGVSDWYRNGGDYGSIEAFDATGVDGCSGSPLSCVPRWVELTGEVRTSPVVVDGMVYVASTFRYDDGDWGYFSGSRVEGFPVEPCWADRGCAPSWTVKISDTYTHRSISAANGLLHLPGPDATTWTYATGGGSPCGGAYPCAPLRRSAGTGTPMVTDHLLYAGGRAFDVTGSVGCAGAPVTCQPLWTAPGATGTAVPTNGKVLVWASSGGTATLSAYHLPDPAAPGRGWQEPTMRG